MRRAGEHVGARRRAGAGGSTPGDDYVALRPALWGLLALVILIVLITINTIVTKPNGATGIAPGQRFHRSRRRW